MLSTHSLKEPSRHDFLHDPNFGQNFRFSLFYFFFNFFLHLEAWKLTLKQWYTGSRGAVKCRLKWAARLIPEFEIWFVRPLHCEHFDVTLPEFALNPIKFVEGNFDQNPQRSGLCCRRDVAHKNSTNEFRHGAFHESENITNISSTASCHH